MAAVFVALRLGVIFTIVMPTIVLLTIVLLTEASAQTSIRVTDEQARDSVQWLGEKFIAAAPRTFRGDDQWGETKRVWSGVEVDRDGWKLHTRRRHRELRHGRWVRYEITVPEPAGSPAGTPTSPLVIESVSPVLATAENSGATAGLNADAEASVDRWRVKSRLQTPATFAVRVERWNLGVKLMSVEISGSFVMTLQLDTTLALLHDLSEVPPAIQLDVRVEQANLAITAFEVRRISKLGGDAAEELGNLADDVILKRWLRKENERLAQRLNDAIDKKRGDLRWSWSDWITRSTIKGSTVQ